MGKKLLIVLLILLLLAGCTANETVSTIGSIESVDTVSLKNEILENTQNLDDFSKGFVSGEFIDWLEDSFGEKVLSQLCNTLKVGKISSETWHDITGNTPAVLYDMYSGVLDKNNSNFREDIKVMESDSSDTVIRIVGDVSLADNWKIIPKLEEGGNGIYGVLSEDTVKLLQDADIFLLNNEFTISTRGTPLANKMFTFRASPKRVVHLKEMGADIVSLANNHAYDFGADAFADTMDTLKQADIPYIGAGADIVEAAKPYYFIVNGRKYAFSAATKAEKNIRTPEATENSSGVMRTYDPTKYIEVIKNAEKECDYNIVYVHWGAEGSHQIEAGLYDMGKKYIDAGADVVVGAHAHILQGIQYYNDVPIVYNLGNFIFNAETIDTGILEINISNKGEPTYKFIPAIQKNCYTQLVEGAEKQRILDFMSELSINVSFDENGVFVNN